MGMDGLFFPRREVTPWRVLCDLFFDPLEGRYKASKSKAFFFLFNRWWCDELLFIGVFGDLWVYLMCVPISVVVDSKSVAQLYSLL